MELGGVSSFAKDRSGVSILQRKLVVRLTVQLVHRQRHPGHVPGPTAFSVHLQTYVP